MTLQAQIKIIQVVIDRTLSDVKGMREKFDVPFTRSFGRLRKTIPLLIGLFLLSYEVFTNTIATAAAQKSGKETVTADIKQVTRGERVYQRFCSFWCYHIS